jgi:hypothetical protein
MTFGWGRRRFAGQALAEQDTFLSVARLVWALRVLRVLPVAGARDVDVFRYT